MKFFALIISVVLSSQAYAEVYKCMPYGNKSHPSYLAALKSNNGGLLYSSQNGYFKDLKGRVVVVRPDETATPDTPVYLTFTPTVKVDWKKEKECWVLAENIIRLEILAPSQSEGDSSCQLIPNILVNPKVKDCDRPLIKPAPPQPAVCTYL